MIIATDEIMCYTEPRYHGTRVYKPIAYEHNSTINQIDGLMQ